MPNNSNKNSMFYVYSKLLARPIFYIQLFFPFPLTMKLICSKQTFIFVVCLILSCFHIVLAFLPVQKNRAARRAFEDNRALEHSSRPIVRCFFALFSNEIAINLIYFPSGILRIYNFFLQVVIMYFCF